MWLVTSYGVLYPAARPSGTIPAGDDRTLQIRARRREYLDHYRKFYDSSAGEVLSGEERTGRAMDYPWACYTRPEDFTAAVGIIAAEIVADQMTRFKPTTEGPRGLRRSNPKSAKLRKLAADLHRSYTRMWSSQLTDLSDGTSSYDGWPSWKQGKASNGKASKPAVSHWTQPVREGDKKHPQMCADGSHWFPRNWKAAGLASKDVCWDCGHVAQRTGQRGATGTVTSSITTLALPAAGMAEGVRNAAAGVSNDKQAQA